MVRLHFLKITKWSVLALLVGSALLLLSVQAFAQVQPEVNAVVPWTLPRLVEELKKNNLQLRATLGLASAAQYGVEPASAPDNPTFNVTHSPVPGNPFAVGAAQGMTWSLSQNIYWPGKKRLAGEIAQTQANAAKLQVEALQVQLIGQLKTSWIAWQQNEAQQRLLQAQLERLDQIRRVTQTRYANNAAAYADYINAQVNQASVKTQVLGLQAQSKSLMAQINGLIGRTPELPLVLAAESLSSTQEVPDIEVFRRQALERNPQLKVSRAIIEGAKRSVELAELGSRPDFNVALLFNSATPPWGFDNTESYGMSVGVTFPLWYSSRERNLLDQAKAQLGAVQDADQSAQQQTLADVETAYFQWLQSLEQVKLVEERIVEQSRVAYRLLLTNYGAGLAGFVDLMNAYTAMNNAEALDVQTRAAAIQARIALDAAIGTI